MDINIVYNKIIEKLRASNNLDVITELENSDAGAATGKFFFSLFFFFSGLNHNNPLVYELIKIKIKEFLKFKKKEGFYKKEKSSGALCFFVPKFFLIFP